uniref:Uncharacterized protein n=3 Tax=Oryza TaxID=4527 RepID=Q2R1Q4_ORYSJ|nr:hypothetical protein LOC_Os11g38430 [Oryza sativa Japonica Group]
MRATTARVATEVGQGGSAFTRSGEVDPPSLSLGGAHPLSSGSGGMWICGMCGFGILREILKWEHEFG